MSPEPSVGLHIGLPKTATTSLQELVFARHPQIEYYGQTNLWDSADAKSLLRALLLDDEPADAARAALNRAVAERGAVMISDEALSMGEFMLRATRWPVSSDHARTARRARGLIGDAHVFLVLRNQADWLESWHRQGLKTGKYAETRFARWLERDLGAAASRLYELLRYDRLYHAWADAFGPERVHVSLYEEYSARFPDLAVTMVEAIGADGNRARTLAESEPRNVTGAVFQGLPPLLQHFVRSRPGQRMLRVVRNRPRQVIRGLFERRRTYPGIGKADRQRIRQHFAESNAALFQELGIEDRGFGYT
ncbi:sulfotransferase [Spiribacter sp. 218]|uniref:sulfotransferase n=1 Tax=Spiribacter pallidus TaxID=1987936 RepID=UPI00349F3A4F